MSSPEDPIVAEQIAYYGARAPEYDAWFLREGSWDLGEEANHRWFAEVDELRAALRAEQPDGSTLELACGTGHWTKLLAERASDVLAVDASEEVLEINRQRVASGGVRYECADLFDWRPRRSFDFVFFGFWLSHIPEERFDAFWELVGASLVPGGRFFFVDNLRPSKSERSAGSGRVRRRLQDGREFDIVKFYFEPADLAARLDTLGFDARVRCTTRHFLLGSGTAR